MKSNRTSSLDLARRILAAGIPVDIPEDAEGASLALQDIMIRQTGGLVESNAFDFPGGIGYMLSLAITVNLPSFAISAFALEVPWGDDTVRPLEDPLQVDGTSEIYRFWGTNLEFQRNDVLNHHADLRRIVPRGCSLTGLLLATGSEPIPEKYARGKEIPAFLAVIDQFGRGYREPVFFWPDCSERRIRTAPKLKPIFECRDLVPRKR